MEELINKREQYLKRIEELRNSIDEKTEAYKNELLAEVDYKVCSFKDQISQEVEAEIDILTKRIDVLKEIITEEIPEAEAVKEAMFKKPEPEFVDIQPTTVICGEPLPEEPIEKTQEQIIVEQVIVETETAIENEVISEENQAVEEIVEEVIENEPEKTETLTVETQPAQVVTERDGMAQIVIPDRR